jgi:excisionase family DNA binding protein
MPAKSKSSPVSHTAPFVPPELSEPEPPLVTKEELAKDLHVGCRTIEAWVAERRIPYIRMGHRTLRFSLADVRRALRLRWTVKEVK